MKAVYKYVGGLVIMLLALGGGAKVASAASGGSSGGDDDDDDDDDQGTKPTDHMHKPVGFKSKWYGNPFAPKPLPEEPPFLFPVDGYKIGRGFGPQKNAFDSSKWVDHDGSDIGAPEGTPIRAIADGYVWQARGPEKDKTACGRGCQISHDAGEYGKINATYCHMSRVAVKRGDKVKRRQVIGYVGNTGSSNGAHLHISLWKKWGNQFDPKDWIGLS